MALHELWLRSREGKEQKGGNSGRQKKKAGKK
jgi:hypothetical protein